MKQKAEASECASEMGMRVAWGKEENWAREMRWNERKIKRNDLWSANMRRKKKTKGERRRSRIRNWTTFGCTIYEQEEWAKPLTSDDHRSKRAREKLHYHFKLINWNFTEILSLLRCIPPNQIRHLPWHLVALITMHVSGPHEWVCAGKVRGSCDFFIRPQKCQNTVESMCASPPMLYAFPRARVVLAFLSFGHTKRLPHDPNERSIYLSLFVFSRCRTFSFGTSSLCCVISANSNQHQ